MLKTCRETIKTDEFTANTCQLSPNTYQFLPTTDELSAKTDQKTLITYQFSPFIDQPTTYMPHPPAGFCLPARPGVTQRRWGNPLLPGRTRRPAGGPHREARTSAWRRAVNPRVSDPGRPDAGPRSPCIVTQNCRADANGTSASSTFRFLPRR
jgi:hypothetical protein